MNNPLTRFSVHHPRWVLAITLLLTLGFASQFPRVQFDNDPENMLAADAPVRLTHHRVKEQYALYDFVIVGVVNETDPEGVFNVGTLGRVDALTHELLSLRQDADGHPLVTRDGADWRPELTPTSLWRRTLNVAFRQDPTALFTEDGEPVIMGRELISPSVVDNLRQAELGALKVEYLMEAPPSTPAEAARIRDDAMNNPLYRDTLVSGDGRALCLYIPITEKRYSYNVAALVRALTADWPAEDQIYITGLPVAEDTFGVEMLVQMATSAPLAGLMILILLLLFFRKPMLVLAPMVGAIVSVTCAMGLLIGLGYDVHIMSSMIAIFIMPIAVVDSVHILSEFFDTYRKFKDKAKTIEHVVGHLFKPMLYTSLTTMAGFGSLAFTPIPPVRVFGAHIAFGVALAWLLTMTFIPAFIMVFVSQKSLAGFGTERTDEGAHDSPLHRLLGRIGELTVRYWKGVLGVAALVIAVAAYGISQITINDNPVKWFEPEHEIRVADRVLNAHFGGTYTAYLTFSAEDARTALTGPALGGAIEGLAAVYPELPELKALAAEASATADFAAATAAAHARALTLDDALYEAEAETELYYDDAVTLAEAMVQAPTFKRPGMLAWIRGLQEHMATIEVIGKTSSAVDALQKAHYEIMYQEDAPAVANDANYSIPHNVPGIAQVFIQLEGTKKRDSLFHLITRDYEAVNLWVQLRSGDNRDMAEVTREVDAYIAANPPPVPLQRDWAGLTYINVVWQEQMVAGMLNSLAGSFVMVLIMMVILFRSPSFGALSMIPLSITIAFIYGLIGLVGKDYDMPVAVLSSLTLGLSVDFSIHFLERAREMVKKHGSWAAASGPMFAEPASAIARNGIVIAVGFLPLLVAPLVPYQTVGFFLATIMAVSGIATLILLPALITPLAGWLFPAETAPPTDSASESESTDTRGDS